MKDWIDTIKRLSDTQRFSQVCLYKSENVLEHSGMVCLISLAIATRLKNEHFDIIKGTDGNKETSNKIQNYLSKYMRIYKLVEDTVSERGK